MPINHTINTDWVELNLKSRNLGLFETAVVTTAKEARDKVLRSQKLQGAEKIAFGKTVLKRSGNGNKFYRDYYTIWHRNKKYGCLFANSRDKALMPLDNLQLKVNNNKLYENGWLDDLKTIMQGAQLEYKSFVRLDIAIDGGKYFDIWKKWQAGELDKVGRAMITTFQTGKKDFEGYRIGKSKSKKRVTCYNKSLEMKLSNKWYIEKYWKRSGLAIDGDVERCELALKNEEGKKYKDIDWQRFDDFEHLASIMQSNLNGFYEWVIPNKDKNITRKTRFNPIDWDALGAEYLDKDSTRPTEELWAGKIVCKKMVEIFVVTQRKLWLNMAYEIAINLNAVKWFNERSPEWEEDMKHRIALTTSGQQADTWLTTFKEYNPNEQIAFFDEAAIRATNYVTD